MKTNSKPATAPDRLNSSEIDAMIDPKTAQLTAINESLTVLDYGMASRDPLPADQLVLEAFQLLLLARKALTDKPWPKPATPTSSSRAFAVWHWEKQEQQQRDGRA
jgi:hypothetical protein